MLEDRQYDSLAADYHWLYSDRVLIGEPFLAELRTLLAALEPGATILDCACGIGVHAAALERCGYNVYGADASPTMVDEARRRTKGLKIPFEICKWHELATRFQRRFDVVICWGNAIGHCASQTQMYKALQGMHDVLVPGGYLVVDTRNWEKLRVERSRFTTLDLRVRKGVQCTPLYVWTFPDKWSGTHLVEVVFLFVAEGKVSFNVYPIAYHPFRHRDLLTRMRSVGFGGFTTNYAEDKDAYQVVVQRELIATASKEVPSTARRRRSRQTPARHLRVRSEK